MLVVNPQTPVKNLSESSNGRRATRGAQLRLAGIGTGGHLAASSQGDDRRKAEHIPYKRARGPLMDLIAGQYHFNSLASSRRKSRCARASCGLAVTTQACRCLPDLPAVAEALPGFEFVAGTA